MNGSSVEESTTSTSTVTFGPPDITSVARHQGPGEDKHATGISIDVPDMSTTASTTLQESQPSQAVSQHQVAQRSESTGTTADHGAPTTVNTSALPVFGMASTMTPTTTNYGFNATLTPLGDDKVSVQKPKQSKKNASGDGDGPKKPSPRVRNTAPKGEKAEKRKASPRRSAATNIAPNTAAPSASAAVSKPQSTPTNRAFAGVNGTQDSSRPEVPPSEDIELRKAYLQSIYRQLQMTHRNQDDLNVRRLATNIEIEICSRAKTRNEYISLMNQHINSLMQAELTNGSVGLQSSLYVPGQGPAASSAMDNGIGSSAALSTSNSMSTASTSTYNQHSYTPTSSTMAQRASTPTQGSFMSLLSSQGPAHSYDADRQQQQYPSAPGRPPQYSSGVSAPAYRSQTQNASAGLKSELASASQPSTPVYPDSRASTTPTMNHAPPDFSSRFQQLDRNALIDLLWTQHKTVVQYQARLQALESHLRSGGGSGTPSGIVGATSNPGAYYGASPRPSGVPPALSAEAEYQRANDRRASREQQQAQPQYGSSPAGQTAYPPTAQSVPAPTIVQNPAQYWEKVRYLKDGFLRPLYVAHQALSQHGAPSNSAQSMKAENVKHNITLACSILSETPKPMQPRPMEVLESIERFIHTTVVPIVRKVQPMQPMPPAPDSNPSVPLRPQYESPDVQRNATGGAPGAPVSAGEVIESPATKPAVKSAGAKGTTKGGGKKSPSSATKKATPKTTTPKAAKTAAKKASARGAKSGTATAAPNPEASVIPVPAVSAGSEPNTKITDAPNPAQDDPGLPAIRSGGMTDDDGLNDFADFDDLDFGEDLQDPLGKVQQTKDNAAGEATRKRSIEDV